MKFVLKIVFAAATLHSLDSTIIASLLSPSPRLLRTWLLLLLFPQSLQTDTRYLDHLKANTGDITLCLALATETSKQNLVVLVDKVQTTVVRNESGNFLAILNQLHLDTLPNCRVWLFGFNANFFQHDSLSVG